MKRRESLFYEKIKIHCDEIKNKRLSQIKNNATNQIIFDEISNVLLKCNKIFYEVGLESERKPRYIVFSFLDTSFLMQKYEIQINFYDDRYYMDNNECSEHFSYTVLMDCFEKDIRNINRIIKDNFIKVMDYELDLIRWNFKKNLLKQIKYLLVEYFQDKSNQHIINQIAHNYPIQITFGNYFNQQENIITIN